MHRYCTLLIALALVFLVAGCDKDSDPQETEEAELQVVSVEPPGGTIASNVSVTVVFSKKVESATMKFGGTPVSAVTHDNKTYVISPLTIEKAASILGVDLDCVGDPPTLGPLMLTIEAEDDFGQNLAGFAPIEFALVAPDFWPPRVCGVECDPMKGAVDVDPAEYPIELVVAFNEPMTEAKVLSTDPKFDFAEEFTELDKKLEIKFLDYNMPYGTEFKIRLSATDRAGNSSNLDYWFTTMTK